MRRCEITGTLLKWCKHCSIWYTIYIKYTLILSYFFKGLIILWIIFSSYTDLRVSCSDLITLVYNFYIEFRVRKFFFTPEWKTTAAKQFLYWSLHFVTTWGKRSLSWLVVNNNLQLSFKSITCFYFVHTQKHLLKLYELPELLFWIWRRLSCSVDMEYLKVKYIITAGDKTHT